MSMRGFIWAIGLGFACIASAACSGGSGEDAGETSDAVKAGGTGTEGASCTCKDAQGNSHSGTFTNDVDGLNCAGSWGSVACTDSSGNDNGKCKSAMKHVPLPPISFGNGAPPPAYTR